MFQRKRFENHQQRVKLLSLLLIIIIFVLITGRGPFLSNLYLETAKGATPNEAFEAIVNAFEKVREASLAGLAVDNLVEELNVALKYFHEDNYDQAYEKAEEVYQAAIELLENLRWGKIIPYILIPINIVLFAAVIVFFGKDVLKWYRNRRDEEFMELEIVYNDSNDLP